MENPRLIVSSLAMRIDDFLETVTTETNADRLWASATGWLSAQGFDKVLHLSIGSAGVSARTTLGDAFEQHYRTEGLAQSDPFAKYCLTAPGPVSTGIDYLGDYGYLVPEERRVIATAADAGFRAGFSVVTRRDGQGCEAWNLGSSLGRREIDRIRQEKLTELRLALLTLRCRLGTSVTDVLSKRERQCMDLLGQGLRSKAIAQELGLATVTVELHLRNVRTKLGASTRDQALLLYRSMFN
jgi:DNA-binding CsgD family transcriptional regulator